MRSGNYYTRIFRDTEKIVSLNSVFEANFVLLLIFAVKFVHTFYAQ